MSTPESPFTAESRSVRQGTAVRQALIGNRPVVAGTGNALEAILIAETHALRHTPRFLGCGVNGAEVKTLLAPLQESALLLLMDSIAADGGRALLEELRQGPHPPLVVHVTVVGRWLSEAEMEAFPADGLLSVQSIGTGRFNAALAAVLAGLRYRDEALRPIGEEGGTAAAGLNRRELEVARAVASGQSNREIAASLSIAETTVRDYVSAALKKLALSNRAALAAWAAQQRLI
jgi:DNA-binding NarL/FixJ family response regulator